MIKLIYIIFINLILMQTPAQNQNKDFFSYEGGWPINKNKELIINSSNTNKLTCPNGLGCECKDNNDCINSSCIQHNLRKDYFCNLNVGDTFPHFVAIDQFGEKVDIYDFANDENKYIIIEMGTAWCSPCHMLSSWLSWDEDEIKKTPIWRNEYDFIYDLIKNDEIYFITILYEDEFRDTATYDTAYEWYNTYPDEKIPILIDENKLLHSIIRPTGIPAVSIISPNMKVEILETRGLNTAFDYLVEKFRDKSNNQGN
ncbi:MAG: hypothetical protein CMG66_01375 [Candidatus Marinimicrobia bacterium]|nr:hypothetical protein [Candidatus Neomarinimicrobiota bacterium]